MRKLSYLFVGLGVLAPFVSQLWISGAKRFYVERDEIFA